MIKISMFVLLSVALASGDLCGMLESEVVARVKRFHNAIQGLHDYKNPTAREKAFKDLKYMIERNIIHLDTVDEVVYLTRCDDELSQQMAFELFTALFAKDRGFSKAGHAAASLVFEDQNYPRSLKVKAYGFKILAELLKYNRETDLAYDAVKYRIADKDENMQKGAIDLRDQLIKRLDSMRSKL